MFNAQSFINRIHSKKPTIPTTKREEYKLSHHYQYPQHSTGAGTAFLGKPARNYRIQKETGINMFVISLEPLFGFGQQPCPCTLNPYLTPDITTKGLPDPIQTQNE